MMTIFSKSRLKLKRRIVGGRNYKANRVDMLRGMAVDMAQRRDAATTTWMRDAYAHQAAMYANRIKYYLTEPISDHVKH